MRRTKSTAVVAPIAAPIAAPGAAHIAAANVQLKRAYEPAAAEDGTRVLIDRLWPRGVRKVDAALDLWLKELAPSTELRKWFNHDPARWAEFQTRYADEVQQQPALIQQLRDLALKGSITLVYAAQDTAHNDAVVLRGLLLG